MGQKKHAHTIANETGDKSKPKDIKVLKKETLQFKLNRQPRSFVDEYHSTIVEIMNSEKIHLQIQSHVELFSFFWTLLHRGCLSPTWQKTHQLAQRHWPVDFPLWL